MIARSSNTEFRLCCSSLRILAASSSNFSPPIDSNIFSSCTRNCCTLFMRMQAMRSSDTCSGNSFFTMSAYAISTLTIVLANLRMYRFQISGSGHSSLLTTSKHCVNCVNTSTTEFENKACSLLFWNCKSLTRG